MHKITIASTALAATMILAACTKPAGKEDEAVAPVEVVAEPVAADTEAKPDAAKAGAAAEAPTDGAADTAAQGKEHTGGINVAPSN